MVDYEECKRMSPDTNKKQLTVIKECNVKISKYQDI